ncbi:MAG: hypothetical protein J0L72_00895 [Armatimonadetes bacterium]|nr:hypothetical protein [Armatimonadota bacterium]
MAAISSSSSISAEQYFGVTPAKEKTKLNMETFMRLLSVQLANQNPLEPMNDRDFFAQMAQLGQVQGSDKTNDKLEVIQATSLIGKKVTALRPNANALADNQGMYATGQVVKMIVKNGEQLLTIKEANGGTVDVTFDSIQEIAQ